MPGSASIHPFISMLSSIPWGWFFGLFGAFGFGAIFSAWMTSRAQAQQMRFEARVRAYERVAGHVADLFQSIEGPYDQRVSKIGKLASALYLVGSEKLVWQFDMLKLTAVEWRARHDSLDPKEKEQVEEVFKKAKLLASAVRDQMRKDLRMFRGTLTPGVNPKELEKKFPIISKYREAVR